MSPTGRYLRPVIVESDHSDDEKPVIKDKGKGVDRAPIIQSGNTVADRTNMAPSVPATPKVNHVSSNQREGTTNRAGVDFQSQLIDSARARQLKKGQAAMGSNNETADQNPVPSYTNGMTGQPQTMGWNGIAGPFSPSHQQAFMVSPMGSPYNAASPSAATNGVYSPTYLGHLVSSNVNSPVRPKRDLGPGTNAQLLEMMRNIPTDPSSQQSRGSFGVIGSGARPSGRSQPSSGVPVHGSQTVPHAFAPRKSDIMNQPPPIFNLKAVAGTQSNKLPNGGQTGNERVAIDVQPRNQLNDTPLVIRSMNKNTPTASQTQPMPGADSTKGQDPSIGSNDQHLLSKTGATFNVHPNDTLAIVLADIPQEDISLPVVEATNSNPATEMQVFAAVPNAMNGTPSGRPSADILAMRSPMLRYLTSTATGAPSVEVALSDAVFPFMPCYEAAKDPKEITMARVKNIPYSTTRAEIVAIIGRGSRLRGDNEEPVHIIMDKVTSKTQDAFVEFATKQDAIKCVDRFNDLVQKRRQPRLGQRPIEIELATQAEFMKALFPFANGVRWDNCNPVVQDPVPGEPWTVFRGFVTREELTLLVKYVESPSRNPFGRDCPQRPFESYISTIKKYPWHKPELISMGERHFIAAVGFKLVYHLAQMLSCPSHDPADTCITPQLLKRLVAAYLTCPGFSATQKDNVVFTGNYTGNPEELGMPRLPEHWRNAHFLVPKPGAPVDLVEWFIAVIREESVRHMATTDPAAYAQWLDIFRENDNIMYWGFINQETGWPTDLEELSNRTVAELAELELAAAKRIVHRALTVGQFAPQA
ncbi:hypothetical protein QBC47DRAFT_440951 [Echria macrotheca]|uniref:Uncharacterized protein n=1 Tax=Echria macrotheca TaxID=438768 RepID=A0AAJ0BHG4_9PEZI|nr:hypothetical protein QBC47DRAFT_440951 [Echria macrotheca]